MGYKHFISLFIILAFANFIYSQDVRTLVATIYDQYPGKNSDFEPEYGSLTKGLVKTKLNSLRYPEIGTDDKRVLVDGRIYNPQLFPTWWNSDEKYNRQLTYNIDVKKVLDSKTNTYTYQFVSKEFFPIDKRGWDEDSQYRKYKDDNGNYHNYHFCLKINYKFNYQGYETFLFSGDDDVWVFINGNLAVDLGGLHTQANATIDLSKDENKAKLGISPGSTYNFDFFYCERRTFASNMIISTNFDLFCPKFDYCGTCLGGGCCKPEVDCNDNDPCTDDICPSNDDPLVNQNNWRQMCDHKPKNCKSDSQCYVGSCEASSGKCIKTPLPPVDKTSECKFASSCSDSSGWSYGNSCNKTCQTGNCKDGVCEVMDANYCANKLGLGPCYSYSCDANGSGNCVAEPICKQNQNNPCLVNSCNVENDVAKCIETTLAPEQCDCDCTGQLNGCNIKRCNVLDGTCAPIPKDGIDDGNLCTEDHCDEATGKVTHTPMACGSCSSCDKGKCISQDSLCDDSNICTSNKCGANSTCEVSKVSCDDGNPCTIDSCDQFLGCVNTPIECEDDKESACNVGYCDVSDGQCKFKPRQCTPENAPFCLVYECDQNSGCISYDKPCVADNSRCEQGYCNNETRECLSKDYDPQPFICKTAAVVSTAVIAGVTVAGAVALGLAIFGGKKGYDYWKESRGSTFSSSNSNPLYVQNPNGGENPLYASTTD